MLAWFTSNNTGPASKLSSWIPRRTGVGSKQVIVAGIVFGTGTELAAFNISLADNVFA